MAPSESEPAPPPASGDAAGDPSIGRALKAAGMTPGVWIGIAGYFLLVAASLLTWYSVGAQIPQHPDYAQPTTVLQFDGVNGLYVHQALKDGLGLGVPQVGFPIAILFFLSAVLKIRKIVRSNQHKMRAATLTRSSLAILIPVAITLSVIFTLPNFIPDAAPAQAHQLAQAIASSPFGGSANFSYTYDPDGSDPLPEVTYVGTLSWGFGPALFLMLVAAVMMNVGSQLEMRVYRRAIKELEDRAAVEAQSSPNQE